MALARCLRRLGSKEHQLNWGTMHRLGPKAFDGGSYSEGIVPICAYLPVLALAWTRDPQGNQPGVDGRHKRAATHVSCIEKGEDLNSAPQGRLVSGKSNQTKESKDTRSSV